MSHAKSLRLFLIAGIAAAAFAPRAAQALAPGTLASHHAQYYYSNSRAPCTTWGVGAVTGACAGRTVISYRPVVASTTYSPRYVPLFGGVWARPVAAPLAPSWGACPPACTAPPQPECCDTLRMVPWGVGDCVSRDCGTGLPFDGGPPHEVTRIIVPASPVPFPMEQKPAKAPAKPEEKQPAAEKKPAEANPASAPRLTDPRDRLTMLPIRMKQRSASGDR